MVEGIGGGGRGCGVRWVNAAGKSEGRRRGGRVLGAGSGRAKGPAAARVGRRARGRERYRQVPFSQAGRSDECLTRPRVPATSALRAGTRLGGLCLSPHRLRREGRPSGRGSPAAGPATLWPLCPRRRGGGSGAAGPSRAPRSGRRSPSAGCRRASLTLGPRRGRRAAARAEAMPWGDARQGCLTPDPSPALSET